MQLDVEVERRAQDSRARRPASLRRFSTFRDALQVPVFLAQVRIPFEPTTPADGHALEDHVRVVREEDPIMKARLPFIGVAENVASADLCVAHGLPLDGGLEGRPRPRRPERWISSASGPPRSSWCLRASLEPCPRPILEGTPRLAQASPNSLARLDRLAEDHVRAPDPALREELLGPIGERNLALTGPHPINAPEAQPRH